MRLRTVVTLLILSAFAAAGANSASAENGAVGGHGFHRGGDGSFHGRFRGQDFRRRGGDRDGVFVGGYGGLGGYGVSGGYGTGYGMGAGDWYGISSGHDECPLFRKRMMTPDGWRIQMVPVC